MFLDFASISNLNMKFELQKKKALEKYQKAKESGEVDREIIELLDFLNSLPNLYTTSSCAGRIMLLQEFGIKKKDHKIKAKWHSPVKWEEFLKALEEINEGLIWLKQEPFILHVVGKTLEDVQKILKIALETGFKHSGIFVFEEERYILEINGTQTLSLPVKKANKLLIPLDYLKFVFELAIKKLERNREARERFFEMLKKEFDTILPSSRTQSL